MAVNRYQNHLVVVLEDNPYRDIMNGVKQHDHVVDAVIDIKNPVGGWTNVFASLDAQEKLLNSNPKMHLLLLIDFDHAFSSRYTLFQRKIDRKSYQDRVFLLGIDHKQSEDLKATMGHIHFEALGQKLVEDCPTAQTPLWQNTHLSCNQSELTRMQQAGVFKWLFR